MNNLTFMDLQGNLITDPQAEIKQINHPIVQAMEVAATLSNTYGNWSSEDHERFNAAYHAAQARPAKKINYRAIDLTANIGVTELWGKRSTQEDRIVAATLPEFEGITKTDAQLVLTTTPLLLQDILTQHDLGSYQGSTLCSTVIQGDSIYTTSIGDSTAFSCVIDVRGKTQLTQLNRIIHHPQQGRLVKSQTGISLAVSRAIGDRQFEEVGLTHEADFYLDKIDVPTGGSAFVINACDGLMDEYWQMSMSDIEEYIAKIHKEIPKIKSDELSLKLAQEAYNRGSTDNISVMVVPIHPEDKTPKLMVIFDGHGGDQVSEVLRQLYLSVLQNQLLLAKLKNRNPARATKFENLIKEGLKKKTIQETKEFYKQMNNEISNSAKLY